MSAQNGLNELVIKEIVGDARTMGCFVNFGADYLEPGVIQYAGRGAVVLGEIDGRMTPRVEELHRAFLDFDDRAIVTTNIWGFLWGKLGYGAQLFATALTNDSIADALADQKYRDVYIDVAREVMRVAEARGVKPEGFNGFDPKAFAPGADRAVAERSLDEMVAHNRTSAKTHSGIWRDIAVRSVAPRPTLSSDRSSPLGPSGCRHAACVSSDRIDARGRKWPSTAEPRDPRSAQSRAADVTPLEYLAAHHEQSLEGSSSSPGSPA